MSIKRKENRYWGSLLGAAPQCAWETRPDSESGEERTAELPVALALAPDSAALKQHQCNQKSARWKATPRRPAGGAYNEQRSNPERTNERSERSDRRGAGAAMNEGSEPANRLTGRERRERAKPWNRAFLRTKKQGPCKKPGEQPWQRFCGANRNEYLITQVPLLNQNTLRMGFLKF